jgi:putative membrane protein
MWNGGYGGGWGWGGWILMAVVLIVVFAVIITAIALAVRYLTGASPRSQGGAGSARGAEDVLGERFARGEIDEEEFRRRVTALREHR